MVTFFLLLQKFNNREEINLDLKRRIEAHFAYKWNNDKGYAFEDEIDRQIFDELPEDVQIALYKNFLYCDFLKAFKRFFCIPDRSSEHQPAFYNWEN